MDAWPRGGGCHLDLGEWILLLRKIKAVGDSRHPGGPVLGWKVTPGHGPASCSGGPDRAAVQNYGARPPHYLGHHSLPIAWGRIPNRFAWVRSFRLDPSKGPLYIGASGSFGPWRLPVHRLSAPGQAWLRPGGGRLLATGAGAARQTTITWLPESGSSARCRSEADRRSRPVANWLMKSEPDACSIDDLQARVTARSLLWGGKLYSL